MHLLQDSACTLLSSTNVAQYVNFPTHIYKHTLDLIIARYRLSPDISPLTTPSDIYNPICISRMLLSFSVEISFP